MRGDDQQQHHMFSYLSPEMRVRKDHPLRATIRCVRETWPPQFRCPKSEPMYVSSSIELEPEGTKTPDITLFDIINDEQHRERKHAANQFFSIDRVGGSPPPQY